MRHVTDYLFGCCHLFGAMGIDHRSVLCTNIIALAVERGRIVNRKKYFEQITVADLGRIKVYLYHLGMTR